MCHGGQWSKRFDGLVVMTLTRIARDQGLIPHWDTYNFCLSESTVTFGTQCGDPLTCCLFGQKHVDTLSPKGGEGVNVMTVKYPQWSSGYDANPDSERPGFDPHRVTDIFCRSEPTDRRCLLLHMCLRQTEIRVKILGGLFLLADWRNIGGSRFSDTNTPDSCESQTGTFSINQTIVFKRTLTLLIDFINVHHNTPRKHNFRCQWNSWKVRAFGCGDTGDNFSSILLWFFPLFLPKCAQHKKRFLGTAPPVCKSQIRIGYTAERNKQHLMEALEKSSKQITWWNTAENAIASGLTIFLAETPSPSPSSLIKWIQW